MNSISKANAANVIPKMDDDDDDDHNYDLGSLPSIFNEENKFDGGGTGGGGGGGAGEFRTLSDVINMLLEKMGSFQSYLIILLSLNSIIVGINHTLTAFHVYVPHFICRNDPPRSCNVYVNGTECPDKYIYDETDDITIAVEWGLVCSRAILGALVNTLYFVGVTLGALVCSTLADVCGRKKLVLTCLYAQAALAVAQYYSKSFQQFAVFRMIQGFFVQGLQTCSYTLMLEYCPAKFRTKAATIWETNWALGLGVLGVTSYFIREWRFLTLVLTFPTVISLTYSWIFPESLIWLQAKGRNREALALTKKIAKYNRQQRILRECNSVNLEERKRRNGLETDPYQAVAANQEANILAIFKNRILRKHLLSMISVWFSVTLSYYGILYFLPNLAGQRHLNFLFGAFIEFVAYIVAYVVLSRYGRRIPMVFYQYGNGILLLLIAILTTLPTDSYSQYWLIVIALIAKGFAVSSFCGMFIYCSELFPTVCRGIALGLSGFAARCGSLLAPQLMVLTFIYPTFIPLLVMCALLMITGTITIFLPETVSSRLPNTLSEAEEMWSMKD